MKNRRVKNDAVRWLTGGRTKEVFLPEALCNAVLYWVAVELFLFAILGMIRDQWPEYSLGITRVLMLMGGGAVGVLIYEVLLLLLERYMGRWSKFLRGGAVLAGGYWVLRTASGIYGRAPLELEDGFLCLGYRYLESFNAFYSTSYSMDRGLAEYVPDALFVALLVWTGVCILGTSLWKKPYGWYPVPLLLCLVQPLAGLAPSFGPLVFMLLGIYLMENTDSVDFIGSFLQGRNRAKKMHIRSILAGRVGSFLLLGGILFVLALLLGKPAKLFASNQRLSGAVREWSRERNENTGAALEFTLLEKKAQVSNQKPVYTDRKIFTVTTGRMPEGNLYLKDFEAMDYRKGAWISRDGLVGSYCSRDGENPEELRHSLNEEGFLELAGGEDNRFLRQRTMEMEIRLQTYFGNVFPVPYFWDSSKTAGKQLTGDVLRKRSFLQRRLVLQAADSNVFTGNEVANLTLRENVLWRENGLWDWYDEFVENRYLKVDPRVTAVKTLAAYCSLYDSPGETITDPEDYSGVGKKGELPWVENQRRLRLAQRVSQMLEQYEYSWDLDPLEKDEDPIEYFLMTGEKGYCMHFASAGVMILRTLGIPARYVEGYVVKQESFHLLEDGTYRSLVIDRNRHAWAEIYLEHTGWIPVEMTPGYRGTGELLQTDPRAEAARQEKKQQEGMEESEPSELPENTPVPESSSEEESSQEPPTEESSEEAETFEEETAEETPEPETGLSGGETGSGAAPGDGEGAAGENSYGSGDGPESYGGGESPQNRVPSQKGWAPIPMLMVVLLLFGVCLSRILILWVKRAVASYYGSVERDMDAGRYNAMVLKINRRLLGGLRRKGLRRDPTDAQFGDLLKKAHPGVSGQDWDTYLVIARKAAFSRNRITREEAAFVAEIYREIRLFSHR